MRVAETILQQLGGKLFVLMTGARDMVGGENFLMFRLPNRFAQKGINKVKISLLPSDTYRVEFFKVRGVDVVTVTDVSEIYCDMLREVFERETGLVTRL